jgi:zinc protease
VERFALSNGLRVVLTPAPDVPRVDGTLVVGAGAASAPAGLPHATAVLLGEGTRQRSAAAFREELAAIGGNVWAETTWSAAQIHFQVTTPYLERALALWAEAVQEPAFEAATLERWQRRVQQLRERAARDPRQAAEDALQGRLFPGTSPYAWPAEGTAAAVRALTADALKRFHRERYHPGNATLVVAGDVDAATLRRLLERHLAGWKGQPASPPAPPPPAAIPAGSAIVLVDVPDRNQTAVVVGTLGLTGWPAQSVLVELTTSLLTDRLARALQGRGLSYGPRVQVGQSPETQLFSAAASVPTGRVGEALKVMRGEIDRLRGDATAWAPLPAFRSYALQGMFRGLETRDGLEAALIATVLPAAMTPALSVRAVEYESVPVTDLQALARATLAPERTVVVVAGDRRAVEPQLAGLGAVMVRPAVP